MTNAEFVTLSLIVEQPRHGYDIEQIIEERGMREWTEIGFSSIYYLLKKMEKAGLITSMTAPSDGKGPGRKVYSSTAAGVDACKKSVLEALGTPKRCYPPLQLGMANMNMVPVTEALSALNRYRDALAERLAKIEFMSKQPSLPGVVIDMFDYSRTMVQAELAWIGKFIEKVENQK